MCRGSSLRPMTPFAVSSSRVSPRELERGRDGWQSPCRRAIDHGRVTSPSVGLGQRPGDRFERRRSAFTPKTATTPTVASRTPAAIRSP